MAFIINSTPDSTAYYGLQYIYQPTVSGSSASHWDFTGSLLTGMYFDSVHGTVSWLPTYDQTGAGPITLTAHDLADETTSQSFSIAAAPRPARIDLGQSVRTEVGPYGQYSEQIVWQLDPSNNLVGFKKI